MRMGGYAQTSVPLAPMSAITSFFICIQQYNICNIYIYIYILISLYLYLFFIHLFIGLCVFDYLFCITLHSRGHSSTSCSQGSGRIQCLCGVLSRSFKVRPPCEKCSKGAGSSQGLRISRSRSREQEPDFGSLGLRVYHVRVCGDSSASPTVPDMIE